MGFFDSRPSAPSNASGIASMMPPALMNMVSTAPLRMNGAHSRMKVVSRPRATSAMSKVTAMTTHTAASFVR